MTARCEEPDRSEPLVFRGSLPIEDGSLPIEDAISQLVRALLADNMTPDGRAWLGVANGAVDRDGAPQATPTARARSAAAGGARVRP